jgi:hypothetical protein
MIVIQNSWFLISIFYDPLVQFLLEKKNTNKTDLTEESKTNTEIGHLQWPQKVDSSNLS